MNAILLSGYLKTYRDTFEEFVDKIVKPANADVFCLFKKNTSIKCRESKEPYPHDEEEFIKSCLGENLKSLVWVNEVEDTEKLIEKGNNILQSVWLPKYGKQCEKLEHWMTIRSTVDQYQRLSLVCNLMSEYSYKNNITYKRVLRARPDILPINGNKNWHMLDVELNDIFLNPSLRYEFRDMLFVTDQQTMEFICKNFPEKYLTYLPKDNPYLTILSPECQLMQFMIKERNHNFFYAPFAPDCKYYIVKNKNINIMTYSNIWEPNINNELYIKKKLFLNELWKL